MTSFPPLVRLMASIARRAELLGLTEHDRGECYMTILRDYMRRRARWPDRAPYPLPCTLVPVAGYRVDVEAEGDGWRYDLREVAPWPNV